MTKGWLWFTCDLFPMEESQDHIQKYTWKTLENPTVPNENALYCKKYGK